MPKEDRITTIVGNWKMHKTIVEARAYVAGLSLVAYSDFLKVGVAVPFTMIAVAAEAARGSSILIGAQNVSQHSIGAYTGEISPSMVKDAGASFCIIGHSERRRLFHETNEIVNIKTKLALESGLKALVCVGETLEQRQGNTTKEILKDQILLSLKGLTAQQLKNLILAYEPIWAIGTNPASAEQAQEAHHLCREVISKEWGNETAEALIIQYGGSVRIENAAELLKQPDIDGLLVGGASLELDTFSQIIHFQNQNYSNIVSQH